VEPREAPFDVIILGALALNLVERTITVVFRPASTGAA